MCRCRYTAIEGCAETLVRLHNEINSVAISSQNGRGGIGGAVNDGNYFSGWQCLSEHAFNRRGNISLGVENRNDYRDSGVIHRRYSLRFVQRGSTPLLPTARRLLRERLITSRVDSTV